MHPDDGSAQLYRRYGVIAGAAVAGLVVLWFLAPWFTVNPNERAVVTRWGAIARVAEPGLNWKIPLAESTRYFRIDIAEVAPPRGVNTYTVDNQEVDVSFNVFYRIPPDQVLRLPERAGLP